MEVRLARAFLQFVTKINARQAARWTAQPSFFCPADKKKTEQHLCPTVPPTHTALRGENLNLRGSTKSRADILNPKAAFSLSGAHRGWHQMLTLQELTELHSERHLAAIQQPEHFSKSRFPDPEEPEKGTVSAVGNCTGNCNYPDK